MYPSHNTYHPRILIGSVTQCFMLVNGLIWGVWNIQDDRKQYKRTPARGYPTIYRLYARSACSIVGTRPLWASVLVFLDYSRYLKCIAPCGRPSVPQSAIVKKALVVVA